MEAYRLRIVGVVQGVGFRPFIYRLAKGLGLNGYVVNLGGSEVEVHVEGDGVRLREFLRRLYSDKPPQARILGIDVEVVDFEGFSDFEIRESVKRTIVRSMIPPDIAICDYCVGEILGSNDRFHRYPWNSCAWCGPRFSMMYDVPYDRVNTAMKVFEFCGECFGDYRDSGNIRRFHGQGISCIYCGPKTHVFSSSGDGINVEDPVEFIADRILEGCIVAVKGVGGYHIACLASDDDVVANLRVRKGRPTQPLALMARDYDTVLRIAVPPPGARELLESPQRPILVMPKREGSIVSELVAPGLSSVGVMLPYTGFQVMLLREIPDGLLIMTSGNVHGRPMCTNINDVFSELRGIVDYVVEHDRRIVHRIDDSVIRFTDDKPTFLRRSRGYAPEWIEVGFRIPDSIAVGAELQTAGAVGFEDKVVLTQFIGDIDEPGQLEDLEREINWFSRVYEIKPVVVALDMHPLYHNRRIAKRLAEEYNAQFIEVQHHHAHAASIMGEVKASIDDRFIAITIDGTGYGDDGGIWGGEILLSSFKSYERRGSLKPFTLPGGDSSAIYPVKPLISLLASLNYGEGETVKLLEKLGILSSLPYGVEEAVITYDLARRGRGPIVTSLGRTLDAFSALLKVCTLRTYEGEPPMKLESIADNGVRLDYEPKIVMGNGRLMVDTLNLLSWVLDKLEEHRLEDLALTIQYGLGEALGLIALKAIKGLRNVKQEILVGGGAAVNTHIIRGVKSVLEGEDLKLALPSKIPPGDGGVALGQILIASCRVNNFE
ncbi:MAG: carbamoyltransferase HypF [Candidatus Methanomethylicia archaeon]